MSQKDVLQRFLATIGDLPGADAKVDNQAPSPSALGVTGPVDAIVKLKIGDRQERLLIEAKNAVYPRDVRDLYWQFRKLLDTARRHNQIIPVVIAESLSPGAKELLREQKIGYFDTGGSLFLQSPNTYVFIDRPPPKSEARIVRTLFSGRRAQVLLTLLNRHHHWFKVSDLAKQSLTSSATVSQIFAQLERFDWIESRGQGPSKERMLREPKGLLDAWERWSISNPPPLMHRYFVPVQNIESIMRQLDSQCTALAIEYAITHEAAAQHYEKFLTSVSQVRCRILESENTNILIDALSARPVREGANLVIIDIKSPGELLFKQRVSGAWLANPVQVYLDLIRSDGRSKELAAHLRKERIGF